MFSMSGVARYNNGMDPKPLTETNPYLRDPETVRRRLAENARQSSMFEGARGLPKLLRQDRSPRSIASTKKSVNNS